MNQDEIKAREAIEHPLRAGEEILMEAWLTSYEKEAYTDQLGISHYAQVVYDRQIIRIVAKAEQYEYYGKEFYLSDSIGYSQDGRKWRWRQELVSYSGGGSWKIFEGKKFGELMADLNIPAHAYWRRPPWSKPGEKPIGWMLANGDRASNLLPRTT
jgi:hypothetical protein